MIKALDNDEIIKRIVGIIKYYIPEGTIYIFGSRAIGNAKENSDFDIGILSREKISFNLLGRIEDEIDELPTLKSIDIIDINRTSPEFKDIVLKDGIRL